ncbi:MAG: YitT family protein, partial [Cyclobacteriaceae bacterium]|nr:YitT family protein [Cyclobacteriaceae bacterium]
MRPILNRIIREIVRMQFKKKQLEPTYPQVEKSVKLATIEFRHILQDSFLIVMGGLSASFGLIGFLLPNAFIDGGVTGISLILSEVTGISLALFIIVINVPFIILGLSTIGRQFALKSIIAILLLALFVHFISYPVVTQDKLLIAVFGGFFLGLGIGLAVRGGAVIDGTEVLAIYISRKTSMTIGDVILMFNVLIFFVAAYVFTVEISLYAMLTYLSASKTVDFVVSGIEEYLGVTIISDKSED